MKERKGNIKFWINLRNFDKRWSYLLFLFLGLSYHLVLSASYDESFTHRKLSGRDQFNTFDVSLKYHFCAKSEWTDLRMDGGQSIFIFSIVIAVSVSLVQLDTKMRYIFWLVLKLPHTVFFFLPIDNWDC